MARLWQAGQRILTNPDSDFAHTQNHPPQDYPGIIVPQLALQDRDAVPAIIPHILIPVETEPIAQRFWIGDDNRTRIRSEMGPLSGIENYAHVLL